MHLLIARKGNAEALEVPDPVPLENEVLIETAFSAVSPGTELAVLSLQPSSFFALLQKGVRSWEKIRKSLAQRGWRQTLSKVEEAVDKPIPLGYSMAGRVLRVGNAVEGFAPGDWVAAVGPGAHHASFACVPRLFCAPLPRPEMARDASVAALACIGIHALHRAELSAGSEVAVLGLGVIGQFMTQVLRACGHRVIAMDPLESRREDAHLCGAEPHDPSHFDFEKASDVSSHGHGLDAVFLCMKTDSAEAMRTAAALCRKRGRLMVVGEFPIALPRESAYEKELEVRVCAAYGEGRYDPAYERLDQDYPVAHSRWTVQRNLQLFLRWLHEGKINPALLRPETVPFAEAAAFYPKLLKSSSTLTIFDYKRLPSPSLRLEQPPRSEAGKSAVSIAVVGAGRFAGETHLPNLRHASDKFHLHTLVGKTPSKIAALAAKFHPENSSCDFEKTLAHPSIAAVLLATPHAQHAAQATACLEAQKHVYVEKPLCITLSEMERIEKAVRSAGSPAPVLFVGFNRRFAPLSQKLLELRIRHRSPLELRYTFRAAPMPPTEWCEDPSQGGRFIGEACHAVDWILWLVGCPLEARTVLPGPHGGADIFLSFADGSRAHLQFQRVWKNRPPKESVEIRREWTRWIVEDFLSLTTYERDSLQSRDEWKSKGHREALDAFAGAMAHPKRGEDPYGFLASSRLTLELNQGAIS